ncbi:class I SAM-dependent methyltransferase [Streptomyces sp. SID10815]|uniref:class I SAM-dependent methyltransferase n=1 Tax=Streptomyces sp. SID10815 TaxID=2706027 RepID=UPI0013CBB4BB|nr:class I SAM-dependent methyltransferase [Streptomyces sp. SID10815]NEA46906.1 class I SAM-dependent methyltransferase [Streptomyces sp. SID10815]
MRITAEKTEAPGQEGLYAPGIDHYSSPQRRDAVKKLWEEPVTFAILQAALEQVPRSGNLSVMDIGCGAGEGLHLLKALRATRSLPDLPRLSYRGLDLDEGLLRLAARTHHDEDDAEFWHGDIRTDIPEEPFDIYLSCGVPYSHLTADELQSTLSRLFRQVKQNKAQSVVVIDVLGRYSLEWVPNWGLTRWPYRMNFFHSEQQADTVPMTFWDAHTLSSCVRTASAAAGCPVKRQRLFDRSIMVGRHTATGQFNPGLPPYRLLVNRLENGMAVAADELRMPQVPDDAPDSIRMFYAGFRRQWNDVLDVMAQRASNLPPAVAALMLARGLRAVEHKLASGLGTGHSLTAVITLDGRG